jgi:dihydropteroate synthase
VSFGVDAGASVLRVHDVAAAADFLRMRAVLRGEIELAPDDGLTRDRYPA